MMEIRSIYDSTLTAVDAIVHDLKANHSQCFYENIKKLYNEVKKLPCQSSNDDSCRTIENMKIVISAIKILMDALDTNEYSVEVLHLVATCLTNLILKFLTIEQSALFFLKLLCLLYSGDEINKKNISQQNEHNQSSPQSTACHMFETFSIRNNKNTSITHNDNIIKISEPKVVHLALLHGILSTNVTELFLLKLPHHSTPFLFLLFEPIKSLCLGFHSFHFHSFQLLSHWMKKASNIVETLNKDNSCTKCRYFGTNSAIVVDTLTVLEANWENPMKGVPEMVKSTYRYLIEAHTKDSCGDDSANSLVVLLYEKTMKLSWQIKGKYLVLLCLLKFANQNNFLETYPDAPGNIIPNLRLNYVASLIGEVYKEIVLNSKNGSKVSFDDWKKWWMLPIGDSLLSKDCQLQQNLENYILSWTLKTIPESFSCLVELCRSKEADCFVEVILLKCAMSSGAVQESDMYEFVLKYLHHSSETVRMEVYTILCSFGRKTEPIDSKNLDLIEMFLKWNLNIDSSAFNQRIMSQTKILLLRVRDSTVLQYVKNLKTAAEIDPSQIEFVQRLVTMALVNICPGSCYQRRRSCFQILHLIHEIFLSIPSEEGKKDSFSSSIRIFLNMLQKDNNLIISSSDNFLKVFPSLFDFTDDIRHSAFSLLLYYLLDPLYIDVSELFKHGLSMCNSSHVKYTDTGSLICCMLFSKCIIEKGLIFDFVSSKFEDCATSDSPPLIFLNGMMDILDLQLQNISKHFFLAIASESIHGIILLLHRCVLHQDFLIQTLNRRQADTSLLIKRLISTCSCIVTYMLTVMSGKAKVEVPSFAEIGEALNELIPSNQENVLKRVESDNSIENNGIDIYSLSPEFQILLSCCWHTIKNSCCLLDELVYPILSSSIRKEDKRQFVSQIVEILSSTLLRCRHRGVIEACSAALNHSCKNIHLESDFGDVVFYLLKKSLESLLDASSVSITRRSAGLPLLIQAVVSSENKGKPERLIKYTVRFLLEIINTPLMEPLDEKRDLPQAHAYHIFKVLIADASISHHVMMWLHEIVPQCILGFSSSSWAIRNGALQLFGVLLPRLCGQKKTKLEESEHNMLLPSELFTRCPNLYDFLLKKLKENVCNKNILSPELVPLLALLAKLSPSENSDLNRQFISDFQCLLIELLASPSWHVRNLASTSVSAMFLSQDGFKEIITLLSIAVQDSIKNNKIHGIFMSLQKMLYLKECGSYNASSSSFEENKKYLSDVLDDCMKKSKNLSNANRVLIFEIRMRIGNGNNDNSRVPVHKICSKEKLKLELQSCNEEEFVNLLEDAAFDDQDVLDTWLSYLRNKWNRDVTVHFESSNIPSPKVMNHLLNHLNCSNHFAIIQEILLFTLEVCHNDILCQQIFINDFPVISSNYIKQLIKSGCGMSHEAYALNIAAYCLKMNFCKIELKSDCDLPFWLMKFYEFCQPRRQEVLRYHAANFLATAGIEISNHLSSNINNENASVQLLNLCDGAICLLQDEDDEVRKRASVFASMLPHDFDIPQIQFNVGIMIICNYMADVSLSQNLLIQYLWCKLQNYPSTARVLQSLLSGKASLFDQEYVNVFAEPIHLISYYRNLLQAALTKQSDNYDIWLSKIQMLAEDTEQDIADAQIIIHKYKEDHSNVALLDFVSQPSVFLTLAKMTCQFRIIYSQEIFLLPDSTLRKYLSKIEINYNTLMQNMEHVEQQINNVINVF